MTTNDTLTRARAAIARLRELVNDHENAVDQLNIYGDDPYEEEDLIEWRDDSRARLAEGMVAAAPVLLRLAEAAARLWSEWSGHGVDIGKVGGFTGDIDGFNAAVIDAALAELAATCPDEEKE